ncbi:MAG: TonB family protein [Helicobacteraceae bacterium]|nr:TonB family protein [Helicobacteraceae bacterium]
MASRRSTLSLLIALILYLPIVAALFLAQSMLKTCDEQIIYTPISIGFFEELEQTVVAESIAPANAHDMPPQEPIEDDRQDDRQQEKADEETLSIDELNRLFAPEIVEPLDPTDPINTTDPIARQEQERVAKPLTLLDDLYGLMIYELSAQEREFLEQNLNPIQTITQRYLWRRGYPRLAAQKNMGGEVILGFTLMPNGDITPIEVIRGSGWSLIDDHAIDTIKTAYKDYPRPIEPVRVRMRVIYQAR